jgi:hypothetical protein
MTRTPLRSVALAALFSVAVTTRADEIEREPIDYATAPAHNCVTRLQSRLAETKTLAQAKDARTFLRSLLTELKVPESSQVLVFSRTSLQRQKISPDRPRAIFFNDDVYVGSCQNSDLFELSAVDPKLGAVFYSAEFRPGKAPAIQRHNDACMSCHGSSATSGYPGHMVRSVFPDDEGFPILSLGTYRIDQRTPLKQRWGGWYVTGKTGSQTHLGNRTFKGNEDRDVVVRSTQNRTKVDDLIEAERYLHGSSDIIALMVLEHQAEMHNLLTKANFQTRIGQHQDASLNKELGRAPDTMSETTWRRIQNVGEQLVKYMLFADETPLVEPVVGTTSFAKDFAAQGPRDAKGRSLRDVDATGRLFKYPCSYLIHSEQFDTLPAAMKDYVLKRLHDVVSGRDQRQTFAHLSASDRQAILEILRETMPNLPAYWRSNAADSK